jgi:hypothetical protein
MVAKIRFFRRTFKARILALLCCVLTMLACAEEKAAPENRASLFLQAVDSAYRVAWQGFQVTRHDSLRPSPYFDSTLRYLLQAVEIEREKRFAADSIMELDALSTQALRDASIRREAERKLEKWALQFQSWEAALVKIQGRFRLYTELVLDSTDVRQVDSSLKTDLFRPPGRRTLDSVQVALLITERLLLRLIDSAGRSARIDTVVRFTDQTLVDQYERLVSRLDSLAALEWEIIARPGATASSSHVVDSPVAPPVLKPEPAWPRAVRIF